MKRAKKPKLASSEMMLVGHPSVLVHTLVHTSAILFYWAVILFYECTQFHLVDHLTFSPPFFLKISINET